MSQISDAEYRSRVDPAIETLGCTLVHMGDSSDALTDAEIIERATTRLKMLYDMLIAAGLNERILRAAVRS